MGKARRVAQQRAQEAQAATDRILTGLRRALETQLDWPGGRPPAGLRHTDQPWHRLEITPAAAAITGDAHRDLSVVLTHHLVEQGWADRDNNSDGDGTVWTALPEPDARRLETLAHRLGCPTVTRTPWDPDGHARPADTWLDTHYP